MSESNPYAAKSEAKVVKPEVIEDNKLEVPKGTVSEVLAWAGDDQDRVKAALDAENEKEDGKRKTLISSLEAKLDK